MCRRPIFLLTIIIFHSFSLFGQTYLELIVNPKLFHNVYAKGNQDLTRTGACLINDSLEKEVKILYQNSGSITVSEVHSDVTQEEFLILDDKLRIKEWGRRFSFSEATSLYRYSYPYDNVVVIEYFIGDFKKSVSTLTYSDGDRLKGFQQMQIVDYASVIDIEYFVHYEGNNLIISNEKIYHTIEINEKGQIVSYNASDILICSFEYSDAGKVLSEKYYHALSHSGDKEIQEEQFYSYSKQGLLIHSETRVYFKQDLVGLHCCSFSFEN